MSPPKKTPAVKASVSVRIRVVTRAGRGIPKASVVIEANSNTYKKETGNDGFAKVAIPLEDITSGQIVVRVKKHHHGPDPGPGAAIKAGESKVTVALTSDGIDPTAKGVTKDKQGDYLEQVFIDCGYALAAASSTIARRLTDAEVQKELMHHHAQGVLTLDAASDFVFEHDMSTGEFDPCDPAKCKIKSPAADKWVQLKAPILAGVRFYQLMFFHPATGDKKLDKIPGHRFLRDKFEWGTIPLAPLDQRHVVGLTRLCRYLHDGYKIAAIFTQGVNGDTVRTDCHGHGTALDLGGLSTTLPDPKNKSMLVRLGVDYIVYFHWGRVPMWDPKTVALEPTNPSAWVRRNTIDDDGLNYKTAPKTVRLHYRLEPAPFQEVAGPEDAKAEPDLLLLPAHFQSAKTLFRAVFDFAVKEFSDSNETVGPLPAGVTDTTSAIDDHDQHYVLHPDYPKPNSPTTDPKKPATDGRQAHVHHLHFQLGKTQFGVARKS